MGKFLPALLLAIVFTGWSRGEASPAARVVLLANRDDPDSRRIAEHYAELRHVPRENIIALPMSQAETITWPEFVATVWQPLQDELVRRQWIDAIPMALTDNVGRRKYAIAGHRIAYLVVCRGVPLRIEHSQPLYAPPPAPQDRAEFRTNEGAVDSELSLLAQTNYPINGLMRNPLFRNDHPTAWTEAQIVKVTRLDGPTAADALALVDHALAAERTGLLGRAYVDLGCKLPDGDGWLEAAAAQLTELGFDLDVDRTPDTIPATARFDAPVLYFGWYDRNLNGPFALAGFQFPPGAIAVHIHSLSADTLRSTTADWCGPLVSRGVTATVGNVFEPYLDFLHRPDLLLRALARGDTFGDAAYYAEPALSWQAIAIGDPLYRPFARSFDEQWKDRTALPPGLAGYAALREMRLLEAKRQPGAALAVAQASLREHPSLAVGFALARQREAAGDLPGAARALGFAAKLASFQTDEWALAGDAAKLLLHAGDAAGAQQIYARLLQVEEAPPELREAWLRDGGRAALAAGDNEQALDCARELGRLVPDERK